MKGLITIFLVVASLVWRSANADVIVLNAITNTDPGSYNPYFSGQIVAPNITASGIGRGSGINYNQAEGRYNAKGWTSANVIDVSDYFTFTLDANNGYMLNLQSFVYTGSTSGNGPTAFSFRSSIDSFTSNIGSPRASGGVINLSSNIYQNLTGPVEFRLYGFSSANGNGTFSVNDYSFNGSVSQTPEPETWLLIGIGSCLMLWHLRRMRNPTA